MASLQELQKDLALLRDYNTALEKENQTRNEERKVLQLEIDRLSRLEREGKWSVRPIIETQEYLELKGRYSSLEGRYNALQLRYNALQVRYSTLEDDYGVLFVQSKSLREKSKENTNSAGMTTYYEKENIRLSESIRSYEEKVVILESKITTLERKLLISESQTSEIRRRQDSEGSTQLQKALRRIQELQGLLKRKEDDTVWIRSQGQDTLRRREQELRRELSQSQQGLRRRQEQISRTRIQVQETLRRREEEITRLNRELMGKDDQMNALRGEVGAYASRINSLSEELQRLERNHRGRGEEEGVHLRGQIEKFTAINGSLVAQINALKQENQQYSQRTHDLQRRIMILEEANAALDQQLRVAIENRKSASRLIEQGGLRETLVELRAELVEVRQFNQAVRRQNDELWQELEEGRHAHYRHPPRNHKSPLRDHRTRRTQGHYHSRLPAEQDHQVHSHLIGTMHSQSSQITLSSHLHSHESRNRQGNQQSSVLYSNHRQVSKSPKGIVSASDKYNQLQRKIQQLQGENQVLKKKLIYEV